MLQEKQQAKVISVINIARRAQEKRYLRSSIYNSYASLSTIKSQFQVSTEAQKLVEAAAKKYIKKCADEIGLIGVMTLEMFVTKSGKMLANEIAPRTHNSGHWTIDACAVSQFENHVRCVAGLPVGTSTRLADAELINLIGDDIKHVPKYLKTPNACVHLYGKTEARPGRKMGHVTILKPFKSKSSKGK